MKLALSCIALLALVAPVRAESTEAAAARDLVQSRHPFILVNAGERPAILRAIASDAVRREIQQAMQRLVNPLVEAHAASPHDFLKTLPGFDGQGEKHRSTLSIAIYAATLHYLTQQDSYARLAADMLHRYLSEIARREPGAIHLGGKGYEAVRYLYERIALVYDLLGPSLTKPGLLVSGPANGKAFPFDDALAQKALRNMVLDAFGNTTKPDPPGRAVTNHVILNAYGCLYPIFCLKDNAERERLFDIFWNRGAQKQGAFLGTFLPMYTRHGQGVLPESSSYGTMMPFGILDTIDRCMPELKVYSKPVVREILEGPFLFPQLLNPDGRSIRYGDGKRDRFRSTGALTAVLDIAHRTGDADLVRRANSYLNALDGKNPVIPPIPNHKAQARGIGTRDYDAAVRLLRLKSPPPRDTTVPGRIDFGRTVIVKHAGIAKLRNWVDKDNVDHGLSGYIGGGHYVHSHCTGIGMELYGGGFVMAPSAGDSGAGDGRAGSIHANYRRLHAGNNTVIVNGTSHGIQKGAWKTHSNVFQNTAVNIACEPGHLQPAISPDFGFATQRLDDRINKCLQQRTLALIRTGPTSGYYLDLFRSRSLGKNLFHDYIYHNIGDATDLTVEGENRLSFVPTDRYDNDIGDLVKSPGWRFFENETTTPSVSGALRVTFEVKHGPRFMHLVAPGGIERAFTTALGPPTPEAKNAYDRKKTQILAIRQDGEAWNRPFALVFEPSLNTTPTVVSSRHLTVAEKVVGVEVKSVLGATTVNDIILENEAGGTLKLPGHDIELQGRFAIIRHEIRDGKRNITLYLGDGKHLRCATNEITGGKEGKAYRVFAAP